MNARRRITLALLLSALPVASGAQELGRLFLTPEQRTALDARRKARIPDKPAAAPVVESPTTRVDGYVQRQGGRSTVWLNGLPSTEGVQADGVQVRPGGKDPRSVSVTVGENERQFELKPGQKLDRGSGEVTDVVGDGAVRVRPPRTPAGK
jgi:hypothetical protein